jgi:predicted dehydrogenase
VLCEKPIEVTLADAEAMRDVCAANHVNFMTAFPIRFDLSVRSVKAMIGRGELGRLYAVNGINHAAIPYHHRAWFAQKALAGAAR